MKRPSAEIEPGSTLPTAAFAWAPFDRTVTSRVVPVTRSCTNRSSYPLASFRTRFVAVDDTTTKRPVAEMSDAELSSLPWRPRLLTLARVVLSVRRSCTKMSCTPFVSPWTRFDGLGRERDEATVRRDRGVTAPAVRLRSVGANAHTFGPAGLAIADEDVALSVRVAGHQVGRVRLEHHVSSAAGDRRVDPSVRRLLLLGADARAGGLRRRPGAAAARQGHDRHAGCERDEGYPSEGPADGGSVMTIRGSFRLTRSLRATC